MLSSRSGTCFSAVGLSQHVCQGLHQVSREKHEETLEALGDAVAEAVKRQQAVFAVRFSPIEELRQTNKRPQSFSASAGNASRPSGSTLTSPWRRVAWTWLRTASSPWRSDSRWLRPRPATPSPGRPDARRRASQLRTDPSRVWGNRFCFSSPGSVRPGSPVKSGRKWWALIGGRWAALAPCDRCAPVGCSSAPPAGPAGKQRSTEMKLFIHCWQSCFFSSTCKDIKIVY